MDFIKNFFSALDWWWYALFAVMLVLIGVLIYLRKREQE